MTITKITGGMLPTNCYLLQDEKTRAAAIIDPGFYNGELERGIKAMGVENVKYILLTHGHHDHIEGLAQAKVFTEAEIVMYRGEEAFLNRPALNMSGVLRPGAPVNPPVGRLVQDGDTLMLGELPITVLHTPGHTAGSCCFLAGNALFCGDTLFRRSAGRTDLPTGSYEALMKSLQRLRALPGNPRVLPGHEEESTLEEERRHNPYMA